MYYCLSVRIHSVCLARNVLRESAHRATNNDTDKKQKIFPCNRSTVRNNKKSTMDFVVEYNHKESEGFQVAPSTTEPYSAHQTDSGAIGVQEETPN
jgi:hypothetical protein